MEQSEAWSRYWASGQLHSCATSFAGNYDGELEAFWAAVFSACEAHDRVLDLGTGNGALPMLIANAVPLARCPEIHAVDFAAIRPPVSAAQIASRIKFYPETDATQLPFPPVHFSYIVSQFGLEYMDVQAAVAEIARVASWPSVAAFVLHHPESVIAKVSRAEVEHCRWLLSADGLLTALEGVLPHFVRRAQARDAGMLPDAEAARQQYNATQRELGRRVSQERHADILEESAAWANSLLEAAVARGEDFVTAALQQHRIALDAAMIRQHKMIECALDDEAQKVLCLALQAAGFSTDLNRLHHRGELIGVTLIAKRD